jgi:hypothetical protein
MAYRHTALSKGSHRKWTGRHDVLGSMLTTHPLRGADLPGPPSRLAVGSDEDFAAGGRAATGFVQHRIRGDREAQLLLVGHVLETYAGAWGFAQGLAGFTYTLAEDRFGDDALRRVRAVALGPEAGEFIEHFVRHDAVAQHLLLRDRITSGAGVWEFVLDLADTGIALAEARFGPGGAWARALTERTYAR